MGAIGRWLLLLAVLSVLLSGCASAKPAAQPSSPPGQAGAPAAAPAPAGAAREQDPAASAPERMIVRSGRMNLTVSNVTAGVEDATALARRLGGYVSSTSVREDDGQQTATLTLRIPGPRYDEAVADLRRMATKVNEETAAEQDVTEEFADLGAQLRNQEAAETQYLEILKKAQSVEDVLKVQQQLIQVRGQIERLKGRIQLIQRRVDLASIDLTLTAQTFGFQPFRYVASSFAGSLRAAEVAIGALVSTWWLLLLVAAGIWLRRRRAARRPPPATAS